MAKNDQAARFHGGTLTDGWRWFGAHPAKRRGKAAFSPKANKAATCTVNSCRPPFFLDLFLPHAQKTAQPPPDTPAAKRRGAARNKLERTPSFGGPACGQPADKRKENTPNTNDTP